MAAYQVPRKYKGNVVAPLTFLFFFYCKKKPLLSRDSTWCKIQGKIGCCTSPHLSNITCVSPQVNLLASERPCVVWTQSVDPHLRPKATLACVPSKQTEDATGDGFDEDIL
jgi:hypothetical protein